MNTRNHTALRLIVLTALAVLVCAQNQLRARADVTDSSASGFSIKVTVNIHATPTAVYRAIVDKVGEWWSPDHTFSHDSHNLSIDERPMGCFCEKLPNGGAFRNMEVISLQPGKTLRMSGAIGPLQGMAVSAIGTFNLSPTEDGTKLDFTYTMGGYTPQGLTQLAPVVDHVLTEQVNRLKSYIETGKPGPTK